MAVKQRPGLLLELQAASVETASPGMAHNILIQRTFLSAFICG
jgi:hypothetical protein